MIINNVRKSMLISRKRLEKKMLEKVNLEIAVKVGDTQITEVSCQKLLGVTIDNRLNYEEHIDRLCRKLSKQLGLLKHISPSRYSKGSCTFNTLR